MTGSPEAMTITSSSSRPPLVPGYCAEHIDLGFDEDDLSAFIRSIDSSQTVSASTLPHLPAEILFNILEQASFFQILELRLVCCGFTCYIDTRVLYSFILRAKIIGFLGSRKFYQRDIDLLTKEQYDRVSLLRASFSHIEGPEGSAAAGGRRAIWDGKLAVFKFQNEPFDELEQIGGTVADHVGGIGFPSSLWVEIYTHFFVSVPDQADCQLRWCFALDQGVMDVRPRTQMDYNFESRTIRIDCESFTLWKSFIYEPPFGSSAGSRAGAAGSISTRPLEQLSHNPIAWSDNTRRREEERIAMWKSQKRTIQAIGELLQSANDALQLPEDAFADCSEL